MKNDLSKLMNKGSRLKCRLRKPKGYKRSQQRMGEDEMPKQENVNRVWGWQKREKDRRFAPLRRFLGSRVGQLWNDVYSEICSDAGFGDYHRHQLLLWISNLVELNVTLVDGVPYDSRGMKLGFYFGELWVHPETGVLMKTTRKRRSYNGRKKEFDPVDLGGMLRAVKVEGIWYQITLGEIPAITSGNEFGVRDVVFGDYHKRYPQFYREGVGSSIERWGGPYYATCKRQMGKKQIRDLNKD